MRAMAPFVIGRDPWNRNAMRADAFSFGLWQFRAGTGNFAWAGIDMALADICGKAVGQPLWRLLGGARAQRRDVLLLPLARRRRRSARAGRRRARGRLRRLLPQGRAGRPRRPAHGRDAARRARRPARGCASTSTPTGPCRRRVRMLERLAEYDIDFVEQPVRETPLGQLGELRRRSPIAVCANEGLWSEADAYARIRAREADVYCFSPSWVGSLGGVLAARARRRARGPEDLQAHPRRARHHGRRLPARAADAAECRRRAPADGADDGARRAQRGAARSRRGPHWGRIDGARAGRARSTPDAVAEAAGRYRSEGQYLPWQAYQLGREERA